MNKEDKIEHRRKKKELRDRVMNYLVILYLFDLIYELRIANNNRSLKKRKRESNS